MASTLLFLSSGVRPRYKTDVIRALALPQNGHFTIRYMRKHVQPDLWEKLASNQLASSLALFAYLDQNTKSARPSVIPCRFATIKRSECEGCFVVITLSVRGFPKLPDQVSTDQRIASACPEAAHWQEGASKLQGLFALSSDKQECCFEETSEIEQWQDIIDRIGSRPDYLEQSFFPFISGVFQHTPSGKRLIKDKDGVFALKAGQSYELKISHYHPHRPLQANQPTGWLLVEADGPLAINRSRSIAADSPYDLNYIRLRTDYVRTAETAAASVFMVPSAESRPSIQDGIHLLDVPFTIRPGHIQNFLLALAIGVYLGAPQALRWMPNDLDYFWQLAVIFVPSVIAATLAVYAIRKPV